MEPTQDGVAQLPQNNELQMIDFGGIIPPPNGSNEDIPNDKTATVPVSPDAEGGELPPFIKFC